MLKACQRYSDTYQKNRSIDREVELDTNATSTNITLILDSAMYQCRSREIWHHRAPIPGPYVPVHCNPAATPLISGQSSLTRNGIFRVTSAVFISKQHCPRVMCWLHALPDVGFTCDDFCTHHNGLYF